MQISRQKYTFIGGDNMKTKEAIELTKSFRNDLTDKYFRNEIEYFDSIIELLQRGEKFEAMWGELKVYCVDKTIDGNVLGKMHFIKQKYF